MVDKDFPLFAGKILAKVAQPGRPSEEPGSTVTEVIPSRPLPPW
jgi:hypothetical protein